MKYSEYYEKYLKNNINNDIIKVEKTTTKYKPNSITQVINKKGGIDRNYYDGNGFQYKQISNHNHGNAKRHPFGNNGEHAHDYIWDNDRLIARPVRELTKEEIKEVEDIL